MTLKDKLMKGAPKKSDISRFTDEEKILSIAGQLAGYINEDNLVEKKEKG